MSIREFQVANPHLFGEDSDYDEQESDRENEENSEDEEENGIIENLKFSPVFEQHQPKIGRPRNPGRRLDIETLSSDAYDSPFLLFQARLTFHGIFES